jgi:hypothetical protein
MLLILTRYEYIVTYLRLVICELLQLQQLFRDLIYYQKLILETQFMHYVLPTISETHFGTNTQKNKWNIRKQ